MLKLNLLLLLVTCGHSELTFQCRDQANNKVDWFAFYKIGRIRHFNSSLIRKGTAFFYMDANSQQWSLSNTGIDSSKQALAYTLQQYYDVVSKPEVFSVMYNDEFPYPNNGTWSETSGHAKGVVVFGKNDGFWLIHSVPKFPRNDTYEYPATGHHYGQMGLCVSMRYAELEKIATQLYFMHLFVYSKNLPSQVAADFPVLIKVFSGEYQKAMPYTSEVKITSLEGSVFMHFAKTGKFDKDLYFDLVAPSIESSLKTETWQHETSRNRNLDSWCPDYSPYEVLNVKEVALPLGVTFWNELDHSKYAVATSDAEVSAKPWVCIGDINRQEHQLVRAGGTMCFESEEVHDTYLTMIKEYYPCE